jgi:hypothetical protein
VFFIFCQWQQCHKSKLVIFQEKCLKVLKCYTYLWLQQRHNCSPAASFTNCVMILYLLKVHLQTFISIPVTQKCQILSCDTLVANERYVVQKHRESTVVFLWEGVQYLLNCWQLTYAAQQYTQKVVSRLNGNNGYANGPHGYVTRTASIITNTIV